jgi:hypothetical protein
MIDELLDRLDKVRQTGEHKYLACCPVHGDRNPSMGLSEVIGDDGYRKVLVYCFACHAGAQEVVEALGLPMSVLFEKPLDRGPNEWDEFDAALSPLDRGAKRAGRGPKSTGRGAKPLDRGPKPLDRGPKTPIAPRKARDFAEIDRFTIIGGEPLLKSGNISYKDYKALKLARSRSEVLGGG